ncbi:MAG: hypothetical protein WC054_00855 [Candidatus Nanopelagicales bacterium]
MSVYLYVDVSEWLDALDAHEGPGVETLAELSQVLAKGFEETQARVHVITGSLKGSGRVSNRRDESSWSGEISYGGPAPGYAHPIVRYAKEEFGRGEEHDAMSNLDLLRDDFLHAMGATVRARLQ